jgi:hypothetical protein
LAQALAKLHPAGLSTDWADKLAGQDFFSRAQKATFEHYMQVGAMLLGVHWPCCVIAVVGVLRQGRLCL